MLLKNQLTCVCKFTKLAPKYLYVHSRKLKNQRSEPFSGHEQGKNRANNSPKIFYLSKDYIKDVGTRSVFFLTPEISSLGEYKSVYVNKIFLKLPPFPLPSF